MVSLLAPPEILSAYAFAADGSDPDLARGTHLRLFAGLGPSFPLAPFAVFRLASRASEPRRVIITDRGGRRLAAANLKEHGAVELTLVPTDSDERRTVRVEIEGSGGRIEGAALLDQKNRAIAERNAARWLFSAPVLHKFRIRGDAESVAVFTRAVHVDDLASARTRDLAGVIGLPVPGRHRWYVGFESRDDALRRVRSGAPLRLNPMDRPDGPFDPVADGDELVRVEAALASMRLGGGLEQIVARLVDDPQTPWAQCEQEKLPVLPGRSPQFANASRLGVLQMAAADPGLARFLGFADRLDDLPNLDPDFDGNGWDTLAVVGVFALAPQELAGIGVDVRRLPDEPTSGSEALLEQLIHALERAAGRDIRSEIEEVIAHVRARGLVAAPLATFVGPMPPWLPPSLPQPQVVQRRWQTTMREAPSGAWRATFAFPNLPLAALSALARRSGERWETRHDMLRVASSRLAERAKVGLFGRELEPGARLDELGARTQPLGESAGLLSDQDIPAEAGAVSYRARAADFFGRFGGPVEFEVEPPPRPKPPKPVLRFYLEHAPIDDVALASEASLSPGTVKLTIAVPRPWPAERFMESEEEQLGSAVIVPRLDDMAAGARCLATLELALAGERRTVPLHGPGVIAVALPLPGLRPQERQRWALTGWFTDCAGVLSGIAELPVEVTDPRPPKPYPTGIGLYWTSAPGPSPEVEVKLRWPAAPASLHRVYLTDQQGLDLSEDDLSGSLPGVDPSRGLVAAVGCKKVIAGASGRREMFRLLTDHPIAARPDGWAVLAARLPRSLATVQFLRVVPLGPDGAEPPFDRCGIVPVAVPESRHPPAPRLDGAVDPASGIARLTVVADGFDRSELERDEPGLFDPDRAGSEAPQFRIRRAVSGVADPIYARIIHAGPLALVSSNGTSPVFLGEAEDENRGDGLEPFVRYVYWAEVRLPPERRLPAGWDPVVPPGAVVPVDPSSAQSHQRPPSPPSAPRALMRIPPHLPAAPDPDAIEVTRSADENGNAIVNIKIADPPRAHAKAIDRFRLAVWTQWPGFEIAPITTANGHPLAGHWPSVEEGVVSTVIKVPDGAGPLGPITLRFAYVDPAGRMGAITQIDAP